MEVVEENEEREDDTLTWAISYVGNGNFETQNAFFTG